ncbi:ASCH domain-containing protein [Acetoanaerobium noterae]|uniref:ASCH domain-containing protein n=1 Tax=Acetoanaerobium noterae TaxID=745369 RepID=UPI003242FDE5
MTVKEMWDKYISISGKSINTPYESWHFCNNEADANELAKLTLLGIKRATASLYKSFEAENEPIPKIGDLIVITNWDSEAVCIIEVKKVEILPFKDITKEHAQIEGEGDKSLEYWRRGHINFFTEETKELGIEFNEELEVIFETFQVVYPVD